MQQYITQGYYSETQQKYFWQKTARGWFMVPAHFPGLSVCLTVPCSSCLAERLLYSKERGRRGRGDMRLIWSLLPKWQSWSLEAGIRSMSPQGAAMVPPGYPDMKGAMPLCPLPSVEATHKIPLMGEQAEFHLSRHSPVCVSEA